MDSRPSLLAPGQLANAARGMEFLFMGKHKITHNIGMDVFRNGRKEYFGIISAGVNWFEAKGSCEFLLDKEESIELCIQTIDRSETRKIRVPLDGLPKRVVVKATPTMNDFVETYWPDLARGWKASTAARNRDAKCL